MSSSPKETIYVDIDDEITGIIDKVRTSKQKIVALVLPKRASMLQSSINMQLLKRAAKESKKNIVLITSETALLPLAGAAGLHVAKTLQSKPSIPKLTARIGKAPDDTAAEELEDESVDPKKSVGELSAEESTDVVELEEESPKAVSKLKNLKNIKKIKIPNFERFRIGLFLAGFVLVLLIIAWYAAFFVMPKARIVIKTDTTTVNTTLSLTGRPSAKDEEIEQLVVASSVKELKKTDNTKVATTGERDDGTKSTGTVTLRNCTASDDPVTLPAGSKLTSNNLSFLTNEDVVLPATIKSGGSGSCITPTRDASVTSESAGDKYNLSAGRTYAVAGYSGISSADSSEMTGGTSKIVKIVKQEDIDAGKQKVLDDFTKKVPAEIKTLLKNDGYVALADSIANAQPVVTSVPKVGEEGSEVTVTTVVTYTMVGVSNDSLKKVVEADMKKHIDAAKQVIQDNGISGASYQLTDKQANGQVKFTIDTTGTAGPQLDEDAVKKEVAGKKRSEAEAIIKKRPGVKEVTVEYSPFWIFSTPKNTSKITVKFEKSTDAAAK